MTTREQSQVVTKKKIRTATSGKEIAEAMILHFKTYTIPEMGVLGETEKTETETETPIDFLNAPLLSNFPTY